MIEGGNTSSEEVEDVFTKVDVKSNGYYVAYNPNTLPCIWFTFIEIKFIHYHSCVIFIIKFMNKCNDLVNYDEI